MSIDASTDASIAAFIDAFAAAFDAAMASNDAAPLAGFYGSPCTVTKHGAAEPIATIDEAQQHFAALIERNRRHGVVSVTHGALQVEPMSADAANVTTQWQLRAADGSSVAAFVTRYALARKAGKWFIVAVDSSDEADVLAAAGWR